MQRMKFWVFLGLLLSLLSKCLNGDLCTNGSSCPEDGTWTTSCYKCATNDPGVELAMGAVNRAFQSGGWDDIITRILVLEKVLKMTTVTETKTMCVENIVSAIHNQNGDFRGLGIVAKDNEITPIVNVHLPEELPVKDQGTVVFSMISLPAKVNLNNSLELHNRRLFGVSVGGLSEDVQGLNKSVNITITAQINESQTPKCVFINSTTKDFETKGCLTTLGQDHINCSCDHLTYFGVLLVTASLSPTDEKILSYITMIGCSISLFALLIAVLIFITNKQLRVDDSKKIHISLSVALILLNLHFLPSEAVAASSLDGLCLYMALGLHYSLLATFSWMALEGLHLYLLLVKVFNIYIRRYLIKLSLVGWGVPAVIVSVVVIVDKNYYGHVPVNKYNPNGSEICYITNKSVKMVTTVGFFSLLFIFIVIVFVVIIRWFMAAHSSRGGGRSARYTAKKEFCTVLSMMVLLGITWGLIFFSFGTLTTPGLYAFSILNSLQGFFIFIYFVLSWKKTKDLAITQSSKTNSTGTKT